MDAMSVPRSYHVMVSSGGSVYAIGGATAVVPDFFWALFFTSFFEAKVLENLKTIPVVLEFGGAGWNTLIASTVSRIVQPLLVGSGKFRITSLHETVQVRNAK